MIHLLPNVDIETSFQLKHTNYTEVVKLIRELRNDCSSGYDNIPVKFVKPVAEEINHVVCAREVSTLLLHSDLSSIAVGSSSGVHPVSEHSWSIKVVFGRPTLALP